MNAENFKEFIENPSRLYQLSYQELKSLVLQYPYSTNLHYLLLQKSAMENHRDLDANRHKAATYSLDRTHLYQMIRKLTASEAKEPILQLDVDEEFLELKDLSLLEMTPEIISGATESTEGAIPLPELTVPDAPLTSGTMGTMEEDELDFSLDTFTTPPSSANGEEKSTAVEVTEEEQPAIEDLLEFIKPIADKTPKPVNESPQTTPEVTVPPPYRASNATIERAVSLASITEQLSFSTIEPETASKEEPAPSAAQREETSSTSYSELAEKHRLLSQKLNELIAERASASPKPPVPMEEEAPQQKKPVPQPKGRFTSWVQQFQPDHVKQQLSELMEAQKREELKKLEKKKKKAAKKRKQSAKDKHIIEFAEQSLSEHQTIISETLAELLAEQGQIDKSVKMYERLKLVFPEKSAYFAAIIEKLKNK